MWKKRVVRPRQIKPHGWNSFPQTPAIKSLVGGEVILQKSRKNTVSVWEWLVPGRWQNIVLKDTIWMDRQNTGPEKGHLDAINDTVRTDVNVVCVPDFLLRINLAIMRFLWLVGKMHAVGRSCGCSRPIDSSRTAESP
jgi:hypothetical protein